jgi:hypothetical protein
MVEDFRALLLCFFFFIVVVVRRRRHPLEGGKDRRQRRREERDRNENEDEKEKHTERIPSSRGSLPPLVVVVIQVSANERRRDPKRMP